MVLYLGSDEKLPIIHFDSEKPAFNTKELNKNEEIVLQHFSSPYVLYVGSKEGCGCSFRHALYEGKGWLPIVSEQEEEDLVSQIDHQAFVNYLKTSKLNKFELYSCWDGDYDLPVAFKATIVIDDILHPDFFFKEGAHYLITIGN